jgi:D-xylose 1-dehydrogenase (NADP+, D-xylono-1,5-lactone-forming)
MPRILRWGLLGSARINQRVIPSLRASKRNTLAAVASRDAERSQAYARQWKIKKAYASYDDLLNDPQIDVIYNSLPNGLHAEWTVRAAQAGKHVLCEKPLAISLAEVDAIRDAARKYDVVVAEAFMYRHHAQTLKVREIVQSGQLGRIWLTHGTFSFYLDRPQDVRLDPELGGGSLWDVGCYPVSYARMVFGSAPSEVYGVQAHGQSGVDLSFAGQMRFGDDALAQFDCSFISPFRQSFEIVGEDASLSISAPFNPPHAKISLRLHPKSREDQVITIPSQDLYAGEVEDMAAAVLDGTPQRVSLEDSRANVATLLALYRSAREGKPVQIEP